MDIVKEYTRKLITSTNQLINVVGKNGTANLDVVGIFEGMIELAIEFASKKISGEEETFSDLSLLIFEQNWQGIAGFYAPFAARPENNTSSIGTAMQDIFIEQQTLLHRIRIS
jgi:iron uptake system component EfeO